MQAPARPSQVNHIRECACARLARLDRVLVRDRLYLYGPRTSAEMHSAHRASSPPATHRETAPRRCACAVERPQKPEVSSRTTSRIPHELLIVWTTFRGNIF